MPQLENLCKMKILLSKVGLKWLIEMGLGRGRVVSYSSIHLARRHPHDMFYPESIDIYHQDGTYICNEKYNHKKIRVRIDQPVKSEQKAESDETHKTAEEDRKYVIQV
jgi:hypothetical protein